MLKGEDVVLMLKLAGDRAPAWTIRSLESDTTIPRSVIQRAIERLTEAGLFDRRRRAVNLAQIEEFLTHGMRYVFPATLGGETRGVKTAWAAEPLTSRISAADPLPPVWPDPEGLVRGLALEPIHTSVIGATSRDQRLREQLTLVDALRIGDARIRGVAADLLAERLSQTVS
jgi:hypothetical protein